MSNNIINNLLFNFADRINMVTLNQRLVRNQVITSNIANAETPGYRALGYDFEEQLQTIAALNDPIAIKTSHPKHLRNTFTQADGTAYPDVYVVPTETVPNDGNTVDLDKEMAKLAQNQILYRATVDFINRKLGMIRYAITGGGR